MKWRKRRSRVGMTDEESKLAEHTTGAKANAVAEIVNNFETTELKISSSLPKT